MQIKTLCEGWRMHEAGSFDVIPARVPGTVYTDLLANGRMEDPFYKDNELAALALMEKDYVYDLCFDVSPEMLAHRLIVLHFDGIDTIADIYLNGSHVGYVDNMHRTWEFKVKHLLHEGENALSITFHSPTKYIEEKFKESRTLGSEDCMDGFVHIRKAHCMFGWDWGAHLPDAGLFRPVSLIGIDEGRIDSVYVTQEHEAGRVRLDLQVSLKDTLDTVFEDLDVRAVVKDPSGAVVQDSETCEELIIEDPKLWWPNGYGAQYLYTVTVELKFGDRVLDVWERRIGLRTMTMHREKDEWGESFNCRVNGVDIFAMGADYIPEDHILGRTSPEVTRKLLDKAVFANFNSIRVWGGGYYPEDWFYDICDEYGLVVWQDFMFACAVYDLTPEFEANIRAEFIDNVKRLRHHASLGLWCGNNEMEAFVQERNEWVTKDQEVRDYLFMYERIIPEVLREYDPNTFYWPSSPSSGGSFDVPQDPNRGDVHYWMVWHGNKPFTEYRKYYFRYLSEFGFQSFPTMKTIERISDDPADHNIFSYIMERHQRNGSANGKIMNYMQQTYRYPSSFETVLYASQLLQADGIRYGVEHFRRNRGRCMGAVYWQFNDCWPVASWSSVDYCGRLKALHYYAKRFFAPVMISCEEQGMMTHKDELVRQHFMEFEKSIRLNVANETRSDVSGTVVWSVRRADASVVRGERIPLTVPALTSVWLEEVKLPEVDAFNEYISYAFEVDGENVSSGSVNLSYPKYFRYLDPKLAVSTDGRTITVTAENYAKSVEILNENEDLILSDNYFDLDGGSRTVEILSGDPVGLRVRSVFDIR